MRRLWRDSRQIFVAVLLLFLLSSLSLLSQSQIESPNAPRIIYILLPSQTPPGEPHRRQCVVSPPGLPIDKCPKNSTAALVNWIAANGKDFIGAIGYEDADGDIVKVTFSAINPKKDGGFDKGSFGFEPPISPDAKKEGSFDFRIFTDVPQDVTLSVTLEDAKKNVSQPKVFSFKAVGSNPVITRIDFSEEVPIGIPQELKINFIDREGDLSQVRFSSERLTSCQRVTPAGGQESLLGTVDVRALETEGQLTFPIVCPSAQRALLKIALIDLRGNANDLSQLQQRDLHEFTVGRKLADKLFFLDQWGGSGSAPGQFNNPQGMAVDPQGRIFIADTGNHRIQIFDPERLRRGDKMPLYIWGSKCTLREGCTDPDGGGPLLPGEAQFDGPTDIVIDAENNLYVADSGNHSIQKFLLAATCAAPFKSVIPGVCFVTKWGTSGTAPGLFQTPVGIAVDNRNKALYVVDKLNHRAQRFDLNGVFRLLWGSKCDLSQASPGPGCRDPDGDGPLRLGDGQFFEPTAIAVDAAGNVYVTDTGNHRIQKFDLNGKFLAKWGRRGIGSGQLDTPRGLVIDTVVDDKQRTVTRVQVVEQENDRVQVFDSEGGFRDLWGSTGRTEGRFQFPQDIGIDSAGNIYILELGTNRVQKFGDLP